MPLEDTGATTPPITPLRGVTRIIINHVNRTNGAGCLVNDSSGTSPLITARSGEKMCTFQIKRPDGEGGDGYFTVECMKIN